MRKVFLTSVLALFCPDRLSISSPPTWIVWNVGQGLWTTLATELSCFHFDMGGEESPTRKQLLKYCGKKKNYVSITHGDWDHVRFLNKTKFLFPNLCFLNFDRTQMTKKVLFMTKNIPDCEKQNLENSRLQIQKIFPIRKDMPHSQLSSSDRNRLSNIFLIHVNGKTILVPGDSPELSEKIWVNSISEKIHILILGHHGSRTSTSDYFLNQIQYVGVAIASARFRKYRHPHFETTQRLKRKKIPMLKTETWGNLIFEL